MRSSYGLRAFGIYFLILGTLLWFTLDYAVERLNDSMRQSAESVLLDMSNLLAEMLEVQVNQQSGEISTHSLEALFVKLQERDLNAKIYNVIKSQIDSEVTVTNKEGIVIYDSLGESVGANHSQWNDIKLTLEGKYGARTSFIDQTKTEEDDPKAMYIAAPIEFNGDIVGVLSLSKPISSLETHLLAESKQLQQYVFVLLLIALVIGYLLSLWFTRSLRKIADYANTVAGGEEVAKPEFRDQRLDEVSESIENMRRQIDGKQYVENYVHSLTHELKTPLTSIGGAVELLQEPMPDDQRQRFLGNIETSNRRMSRLVDRMLSLAKLESRSEAVEFSEFDLAETANRLVVEREAIAAKRNISFSLNVDSYRCVGDTVFLTQAVANLLDNAIRFAHKDSTIIIALEQQKLEQQVVHRVEIENTGELIPDYALAKVYDRFFSLPAANDGASQSKSTGLGLSFVLEIMKLHQGSVVIKNTDTGVAAKLSWPIALHI